MRVYEKIVSVFLLILGVSVAGVWALLIITGELPPAGDSGEILALAMHWGSELLLATLCLLTGIYILFGNLKAQRGLFFTLGLAAGSTVNALAHYTLIEPNVLMICLLGIFFVGTVAALISGLILNTKDHSTNLIMYKSGLFISGFIVYYLMNTAADYAAPDTWQFFAQAVLFIIVLSAYAGAQVARGDEYTQQPKKYH
ncbi:MAG: hypothetical protein H8D65_01875 [Spirochaetes bacterium]|nr:hypothetical protein [Spirochaetota bacterium]MBL7005980.1 hypothetical protein [Spirochaetia bacterium]